MFNVKLHYNSKFEGDYEVKGEIYDCLDQLMTNINEMDKIYIQIDSFKSNVIYLQLDLSCSSSNYELNWSVIKRVRICYMFIIIYIDHLVRYNRRNKWLKNTTNYVVFEMINQILN